MIRISFLLVKAIAVVILLALVFALAKPLWNRFYRYPTLEKERAELWKRYKKPEQLIPHHDFKGVLHAHTYRSHDSRGVLNEILPAARQAKLDFIFLADHRRFDLDTFPRGIQGIFNGVIIESGTESPGASMMVTPLKNTVLDWSKDRNQLIKHVVREGGMVFYLHSEDHSHDWANPDFQGMEIYNIHSDLIDEKNPVAFLINGMVNSGRYRHWSYRALFDEQTKIIELWDSLNLRRRIVGMAAVDAHNNQSVRARYLPDGRVEWVGSNAKTISITTPGWKERLLLGKADVAGWAFKMELDTYFHSFNFANTHIFSDTLSSLSLKNGLVCGHSFMSFESLAEAKGFQFYSTNAEQKLSGIVGDSVRTGQASLVKSVSPYPVRFELFKEGKLISSKNDAYDFSFPVASQPGNYRIVARLKFLNEYIPWIYTNAIYVY